MIVELRYLGGLTIDEVSEGLKVSQATIEREWNFERDWLRRELQHERDQFTKGKGGRT